MDHGDHQPMLLTRWDDPTTFSRALRDTIQQAYAQAYAERGTVTVPEDTFALQRRIAATRDAARTFGRAFTEAVKLLDQLQEEELVEAVGEQDGQPNQALTIPDAEGDLRVSLKFDTERDIDTDQLLNVLAWQAVTDWSNRVGRSASQDEQDALRAVVCKAMRSLMGLGKFEPQVSKVTAFADTLARNEADSHAAVVRSAVGKPRKIYRGVTVERKDPK